MLAEPFPKSTQRARKPELNHQDQRGKCKGQSPKDKASGKYEGRTRLGPSTSSPCCLVLCPCHFVLSRMALCLGGRLPSWFLGRDATFDLSALTRYNVCGGGYDGKNKASRFRRTASRKEALHAQEHRFNPVQLGFRNTATAGAAAGQRAGLSAYQAGPSRYLSRPGLPGPTEPPGRQQPGLPAYRRMKPGV